MLERILAVFGALWLANKLEEKSDGKEVPENVCCGCGCIVFLVIWLLGTLLLKACAG